MDTNEFNQELADSRVVAVRIINENKTAFHMLVKYGITAMLWEAGMPTGQIISWITRPTGYLSGEAPIDVVLTHPKRVKTVAKNFTSNFPTTF